MLSFPGTLPLDRWGYIHEEENFFPDYVPDETVPGESKPGTKKGEWRYTRKRGSLAIMVLVSCGAEVLSRATMKPGGTYLTGVLAFYQTRLTIVRTETYKQSK